MNYSKRQAIADLLRDNFWSDTQKLSNDSKLQPMAITIFNDYFGSVQIKTRMYYDITIYFEDNLVDLAGYTTKGFVLQPLLYPAKVLLHGTVYNITGKPDAELFKQFESDRFKIHTI